MKLRNTWAVVCAMALLFTAATAQAQTIIKTNNTTALNVGGSWVGGVAPGAANTALWDSTVIGANSSVLGGNVTWGQIQITTPGGAVTIANTANATATLNGVGGVGIDMSAATQNLTINNHIALGASQTWNIGSGRQLTVGAYVISGSFGITKDGSGTLTLSGANTYTGGTTITAGTVKVGSTTALGASAGAVSVASGAALDVNGISMANTNPLTLNGSGIGGTGALLNTSATAATYAGAITLNSASTIGNTGSSAINSAGLTLSSTVNNNGNLLTLKGTGRILLGAASGISGVGGITVDGVYLNLQGTPAANITYGGTTTIQNGGAILKFGNNIPTTGNIVLNGGYIDGYNNEGFTRALGTLPNQIQITGGISGFGVYGSGTVNLGNAGAKLTWGTPTFNPTELMIGTPGAATSLAGTTTFANAIDLNGTTRTIMANGGAINAGAITGVITNSTGTAGLIKTGTGTLILSAANTYNGDTTISAGTLSVGNNTAGTLGNGNYAGNISIASGATLNIWSTSAQTLSGVISGSGGLNKAYGGTLTLSGANTYSGTTILAPKNTTGFTVNVSSFNSVNGGTPLLASSSLGCPTTVGNGTIQLGSGTAQAGCTLNYTGSGETTDRILNVVFNGNTSHTINAAGSGLLKFTSALTVAPSVGSGSLVLNGNGTGEIAQGLTSMQSSGLSKQGSGTWTLSGKNTYSTPTVISAGKLVGVVNGSCSNSAVTVSAGTLGVSVTNNALQWVCKSLTHSAASALEFAFGAITPSASVAPLQVNGDIAFAVAPTVSCTGSSLPAGTYPLITWTGNLSGLAPTAATLPSGFGLLVVDTANKTLWLTITGSGSSGSQQPLTWQGPASSTWVANEAVFTKWKDAALVSTNYQETLVGGITVGDNVVFGATGAGTVTLNTTISPASILVNSTANYAFSGSGTIGGIGGLTKANSGTLTLSMSNSYSGGTLLSAGTLAIAADNALGTGAVVLGGGTIQSSDTTARALNSPVVLNGSTIVGGSGNLSFTSAGAGSVVAASTLTVNTGLNATIASAMGGSGSITKAGAGTLTLTGTNTLGAVTVNAGLLTIDGGTTSTGTFALPNARVSIVNGGTLSTSSGSAALAFSSGSSLTVTGGNGVTSTWNLNGGDLGTVANTHTTGAFLIDGAGYAGSARVINVGVLSWGRTLSNASLILTNGGRMSVNGEIRTGNPYYNTTGNSDIIIGGGTATSTFTGNNQAFYVGYPERNASQNNDVTVNSGGVLTGIGNMFVGNVAYGVALGTSTANKLTVDGTGTASMASVTVGYANVGIDAANANTVQVTNGGTLTTSSGANYIGRAQVASSQANNNRVTVTGTGSIWNAGNQTVYVGNAVAGAVSTGNVFTVSTGGVVTNISALTVKAANTLSLGVGGAIYANTVTNSGTLAVALDGNATPTCGHLNVSGRLNLNNATLNVTVGANPSAPCVIATYGSLSGAFSVTNLPANYSLDTGYNNNTQIAVKFMAVGTLIQFM